jgi:hypothetical protein
MLKTSLLLALFFILQAASSPEPHRRRLAPSESIIAHINSQIANGIDHPQFTLTANFQDGNLFVASEPFTIDVALTKPSVAEDATFSVDGGASSPVDNSNQFLVSVEKSSDGNPPAFAILSIDRDSNTVAGLVQKDGKLVQLEQVEGGETFVHEVNFDPPKDWSCGVKRHSDEHQALNVDGRKLKEGHHHEKDHHHEHDSFTINVSQDGVSGLNFLNPNMIQGRRKAYATDSFPNAFTYQVDLFIDVDDALVNKHDTNTVNFPNTITYVNALITAISSIYEREVDTRLNVLHIQKTSIYNNAADSEAAIDIMQNNYSGDTWHYTDSNGHQPDLHHGILYKNLQGGENIIYLHFSAQRIQRPINYLHVFYSRHRGAQINM